MDGELELMAHRRILTEDQRGVGEALNETTGGESFAKNVEKNALEPMIFSESVGSRFAVAGLCSSRGGGVLFARERLFGWNIVMHLH